MEYRNLGKTSLKAGVIGLGTEYLLGQSQETVVSVVQRAIKYGVNYIDMVWNISTYLDNLSVALQDQREKVILVGHIGSGEKNGKYRKTRKPKECEEIIFGTLSKLNTDHIDIANVHYVKSEKEYGEIIAAGIVDLALQLKENGNARFVGISTHDPAVAVKAAQSGNFDMIMIQINIANNAMPGRNEMLRICAKEGVGVVAMKPFAGGKLLRKNRTVNIAAYQTGGKSLKKKIPKLISPVQCISYILSQVGVSTTVPGVKNVAELDETLGFLNATEEEKDFSALLTDFQEYVTGECVYCNHCLPCPVDIDIGYTNRLFDIAQQGLTEAIKREYSTLPVKASTCTQCGACMKRCPFEVDVISKMNQVAILFEKTS
ncbi:MAG: aldo/keto reductase [Promethearchaeota archaeon]